jgi:hypothetical protein
MKDGHHLEKMSYEVVISEGDENVVVEAQVTLGSLETLSEPEKRIRKWFANGPIPKANSIVDIHF